MKTRVFLIFTVFLLASGCASLKSYSEEPSFKDFVQELRAEAVAEGIRQEVIDEALPTNLAFMPDLIERSKPKNQTQVRLSFAEYTAKLVSDYRINKGVEKYTTNRDALETEESLSGVDSTVITALWGIESSYGAIGGSYEIVPSLATLSYASHRKEFFRKELFAALKILNEGHIGVHAMKGSWAGAMGQCQFMPTSFIELAADGNGDGKKDIWTTEADVFASAANYLKKRGWKSGQAWGQRVVLTKFLPRSLKVDKRGLSNRKFSTTELKRMGIKPAQGGYNGYKGDEAYLFIPEGPSKKAYIVYDNFKVIMNWNNSTSFAFSVLTLADKIAENVRRGS